MESHLPETLAITYLPRHDRYITTCYRRCSALRADDLWYYETEVWQRVEDNWLGKLLETFDSGLSADGALRVHAECVGRVALEADRKEAP